MTGIVKNYVSKDVKRLELTTNGWVLRYDFSEPNDDGMCICTEVQFLQTRMPKADVVRKLIEESGCHFNESDYYTDEDM